MTPVFIIMIMNMINTDTYILQQRILYIMRFHIFQQVYNFLSNIIKLNHNFKFYFKKKYLQSELLISEICTTWLGFAELYFQVTLPSKDDTLVLV